MNIFIERTQQSIEQEFTGSAKELLDSLSIGVEDVLIIKSSQLVTEDEDLVDSDTIRLLSVISGG